MLGGGNWRLAERREQCHEVKGGERNVFTHFISRLCFHIRGSVLISIRFEQNEADFCNSSRAELGNAKKFRKESKDGRIRYGALKYEAGVELFSMFPSKSECLGSG